MNEQNGENLKDLFERFVGTEEAQGCIDDFDKVKRILDENPAPQPSRELIAAINSRIAKEIRLRKEHTFRRLAYRLAPVAAVFIILASVSIKLYVRDTGPVKHRYVPRLSPEFWDSENTAADDPDLAVLTAEVDELEIEFSTLELGETGGNGRSAVTELEMDFVAISTDIWEG
ncbi:MAG: hypothetical protein GWN67_09230 [Phycisphaerae bacterium]|nr:hypothetical protein [Phycisphaerae bacterium]NIP50480.1 hypothetical protein [Phycisphaerae bacterium]NIS51260.1 hypothetical protein [Phycisphaerae bacterium]NIU07367.1 hypothetical protein [Phycisphaerae bacterium]NIU56547.1 hypothetical protein [Phycisphaerae bacterium]